jgi:hypothetical protein
MKQILVLYPLAAIFYNVTKTLWFKIVLTMIIKESITINSTMEKVWETFTDLTCWVNWNTVIKNVKSKEKLLMDGRSLKCTFRPFLFPIQVKIRIEEIAPYEHIIWIAKKKGLSARHEFLFQNSENGIQVISRESFAGLLVAGAGFLLPVKRMRDLTKTFLKDLKRAAEG